MNEDDSGFVTFRARYFASLLLSTQLGRRLFLIDHDQARYVAPFWWGSGYLGGAENGG